uniref:Uncharacterized protein n=1 Tax=Tetradesmus obliquus TaxID=3088 RepID=A0A383W4N6_TETOB|eukprot:jgi/Sobl393_1/4439/SZX72607.1
MLRVLEWVDDAEAGLNLHCKYVLFNVPIALMTGYTSVSCSVIVRHTTEHASSVDIFTNDQETWESVQKSRVQVQPSPANPGAANQDPTAAAAYPGSSWSWRSTFFGTQGNLDAGADKICNPDGDDGLYLCASIPAVMALAITKAQDFRDFDFTSTHQMGQCIKSASSSSSSNSSIRCMHGFGHIAAKQLAQKVGSDWVAAVLAFDPKEARNYALYMWD